ncbi:MAG TPA: AAA family ATPase, partial [Dokdonella sp.]
MQIRRIAIQDFRKITRREIADLADGLNIVVGDNEAGKSTMLAALRAVFFERHRLGGRPAESMLPYGSAVRPTVAVDFELDGKPWSLVKSFVQRPEASLQGPGERHVGDAVEDRLAELFGFTPPGRGGSDPREHHGTHGLLWVEQGQRPNLGVGAGRDTLAAALEREVGQVTGGERGRALLAAAEERRDRFWDKRDRPRSPVVEARRCVEELEGEEAALLLRQREMEDRLTRLEIVGARIERHRRDDLLGRATAAVVSASRVLQEVERRRIAHEAALTGLRDAERAAVEARERCDRRQALMAKRETMRLEVQRAETVAEEARVLVRQRGIGAGEADARLAAARAAQNAAEDRLRRGEAALQQREAAATLDDRITKLAAAEEQAARHRDALARAAAVKLDTDIVATLTTLERAADRARAELEAASLQITFEPDGERRIVVDGTAHAASQSLGLARDATLELEGFGRLHVQPGGGVATLLRKREAADAALRDALSRSGVASLSDARRQLQARAEAQAEAASLAKTLSL